MLEPAKALHPAIDVPAAEQIAPRGGLLPRRLALAAGLLSLLLTAVLWQGLAGQRSAQPPAASSAATRLARISHGGLQGGLASLPLSARGPISQVLGAHDPIYRVGAFAGGFAASNPVQRLSERFERAGVAISSGSARLRLSLPALGYGNSLRAPVDVEPSARANRVLYAQAGLSEWYANGPLGLEQGFSLARAPAGPQAGPLTLAMGLSGDARATAGAGGQSVTLSAAGAPSLRYGDLVARDANGRLLPSWLGLEKGRLLLRVDARGARYPLRIDPFIQQGEKLTGAGESGAFGALFGFSVALSADGNTALIGGPFDGAAKGAAWVFTRSGSTWTQQGEKLTPASGEEPGEALFGQSVALSADGNTALIGAPFFKNGVGAAWVFTRSGSTWTQQGEKLTPKSAEETEKAEAEFGQSVALSGDGNTALIGAGSYKQDAGAAWTFTRSGSTWAQEGEKLTPASGEAGAGEFGESVALSTDGESALIGAPVDGAQKGAAWAFARSGSGWAQQGEKLTANSTEKGEFGQSVALSADGSTALIGAPADNIQRGTAWAFTQSGSAWTQQGEKLTANSTEKGGFGHSVALSESGETALVGAESEGEGAGAAWAFTRSGSTWTQPGEKLTPNSGEPTVGFGSGVALSFDGRTGMIGAFFDAGGIGAAWAFYNPPPPPPSATIALANPTISVGGHGEAEIMLTCTGTAPSCGAKLTLTAQKKTPTDGWDGWNHEHGAPTVIGKARVSIPAGETTTVTLRLNGRGRRLLDARNGLLPAALMIRKFDPQPEEEQTDPVELVQQHPDHGWWHEHQWGD